MRKTKQSASELRKLVEQELRTIVDARVSAIAKEIAASHGKASLAVLFYGSCLRDNQLDGRMLDFYLIVSDYGSAYSKRWLAAANRLLPPNVFYFEHQGLASKYAVLSEADFEHECSTAAWTVSTAARFAQPSRLAWVRDRATSDRIIGLVAKAAPTLLEWTLPLASSGDLLGIWKQAFLLTFAAELRAERPGRASALVDADHRRYERIASAACKFVRPSKSKEAAERWWAKMQRRGKLNSLSRLAKASFTFSGGADYIAWKINRHSDAKIRLKPWQQRHPLLAAISLLPRLLRTGAVH